MRPAGFFAVLATAAAMTATLVVAAPGGAASGEKEYTTSFEMECVLAPGVLNIQPKEKFKVTLSVTGPEGVAPGQEVFFHGAHLTIVSPVELTESFAELLANEVKGTATVFVLDGSGLEPTSPNIAKPAEYPSGLPFLAPSEKGKPSTFLIPSRALGESTLTYAFGPEDVTATSGTVVATLDARPGYQQVEAGSFRATGHGIVTEVEGRNSGAHVIGPLPTACNPPSGVVAASIPVTEVTTDTTRTTNEVTTDTTRTTNEVTTDTTRTTKETTKTTTRECGSDCVIRFFNWPLKGSLTDHKQGQTITLPEGCTINWEAEVPGPFAGKTLCPPFDASVKLFGVLPVTLGLTLTESELVKGTFAEGSGGKLRVTGTAKDDLGITSVGLLGLTIPTSCGTAEPIVFPLETEGPASSFAASGFTFNGETTLPAIKCSGGFLPSVFGHLITALMSGPNNPFTLTFEP
jgi:hypothetical protein